MSNGGDAPPQPEEDLSRGTPVDPGKLLEPLMGNAGVTPKNDAECRSVSQWYIDNFHNVGGAIMVGNYDALNDQQRSDFKSYAMKYLGRVSPLQLPENHAVKALAEGIQTRADAQNWVDIIREWERHESSCSPEH